MGIIFLDFDGPIFPEKVFYLSENRGTWAENKCKELDLHPYVTYWRADPIAIAMLNKLREIFPYELVISSSWADEDLHNKEQITGLLNANGLDYELHKDWKTPRKNLFERHEQISLWLNNHPETQQNYIVLDDIQSGSGLYDKLLVEKFKLNNSNIMMIDPENGLTKNNFNSMLEKIISW